MTSPRLERRSLGYLLLFVIGSHIVGCGAFPREDCHKDSMRDLNFSGPCVTGIELYGKTEDFVSTNPHCPWERLVRLDLFDGFQPGMTIKEATRVHGPPHDKGTLKRLDAPYWLFKKSLGEVAISHEDQGYSVFIDRWWILTARPFDRDPSHWIAEEVLQQLPRDRERVSVVILNGCGNPVFEFTLEKRLVQNFHWVNGNGSWRPRAERAQFRNLE